MNNLLSTQVRLSEENKKLTESYLISVGMILKPEQILMYQ